MHPNVKAINMAFLFAITSFKFLNKSFVTVSQEEFGGVGGFSFKRITDASQIIAPMIACQRRDW